MQPKPSTLEEMNILIENSLFPNEIEDYTKALQEEVTKYWEEKGKQTDKFSQLSWLFALSQATLEQKYNAWSKIQ